VLCDRKKNTTHNNHFLKKVSQHNFVYSMVNIRYKRAKSDRSQISADANKDKEEEGEEEGAGGGREEAQEDDVHRMNHAYVLDATHAVDLSSPAAFDDSYGNNSTRNVAGVSVRSRVKENGAESEDEDTTEQSTSLSAPIVKSSLSSVRNTTGRSGVRFQEPEKRSAPPVPRLWLHRKSAPDSGNGHEAEGGGDAVVVDEKEAKSPPFLVRRSRRASRLDEEMERLHNQEEIAPKQERIRLLVLKEIFDTEQSYVDALKTSIDLFIKPLQETSVAVQPENWKETVGSWFRGSNESPSHRKIISSEECNSIFLDIESFYDMHSKFFLPDIERAFQNQGIGMGDFFFKRGPYLKLYIGYCKKFDRSLEILERCSAENKLFRDFLESTYRKLDEIDKYRGLRLPDFLIKPFQVFPTLTNFIKSQSLSHCHWLPALHDGPICSHI
jgi:hypothetical protein